MTLNDGQSSCKGRGVSLRTLFQLSGHASTPTTCFSLNFKWTIPEMLTSPPGSNTVFPTCVLRHVLPEAETPCAPNGTLQKLRLMGAAKTRQAMPPTIFTITSPIMSPRTHRQRHNIRIKTRFPLWIQVKDAVPSIPTPRRNKLLQSQQRCCHEHPPAPPNAPDRPATVKAAISADSPLVSSLFSSCLTCHLATVVVCDISHVPPSHNTSVIDVLGTPPKAVQPD